MIVVLVLYCVFGIFVFIFFYLGVLGVFDFFVVLCEIVWQGIGGMSVGCLCFEGSFDIVCFLYQEILVVV